MVTVTGAETGDFDVLSAKDEHVSPKWVRRCISLGEYLVARDDAGKMIGFLRFSMFWGTIPYMDMIVVDEAVRGQGTGRALLAAWEQKMKNAGATLVMTSAMSDEPAPLNWHKSNGFTESGTLTFGSLQTTPEQFLVKEIPQ